MLSSFKVRFVVLITLFVTVFTLAILILSVNYMNKTTISVFEDRGNVAVDYVMEVLDADQFERVATTMNENDPYYYELQSQLYRIKRIAGCKYLFTMVRKSDKVFTYVVDGSVALSDIVGNDDFSPLGTDQDVTTWGNAPIEAFEKGEIMSSGLESQAGWGLAMSVYVPIVNSKGKTVGIVGIDFDVEHLAEVISNSKKIIFGVGIVGLVLVIVILMLIIIPFFGRLAFVTHSMEKIAGGGSDLTARIPTHGESELDSLAAACNKVMEHLQNMVKTVKTSVNTLSENSTKLYDDTDTLVSLISTEEAMITDINSKAGTQNDLTENVYKGLDRFQSLVDELDKQILEQHTVVDTTSSAVEQITASIKSASANVTKMADEYNIMVEKSKSGREKQKRVTEQVELIAEEAERLSEANTIITQIASQTNLLAMNAAIEAAHAGDAGAGFSVVADEIRNLAETSAKQTRSVRSLVTDIEKGIANIVEISQMSEASFSELGEHISSLSTRLNEINNGMAEQDSGVANILQMTQRLKNATNDSATASEHMKNASSLIMEHMGEMQEHSKTILGNTDEASEKLERMKEFANMTRSQTEDNRHVADKVHGLVGSYKTE